MRFSIVIVMVWVAAALGAGAPTAEGMDGFSLPDQFGRLHRVAFPKARISVVTLADRAGSEQIEGWIRPLYERYCDGIDIHGVAKVEGVPAPLKPLLCAMFRRSFTFPILMDWTGAVSRAFGHEARVANVVVLSPAGHVVYRFNGRAEPAELRRCFHQIDRMLRGTVPSAD